MVRMESHIKTSAEVFVEICPAKSGRPAYLWGVTGEGLARRDMLNVVKERCKTGLDLWLVWLVYVPTIW